MIEEGNDSGRWNADCRAVGHKQALAFALQRSFTMSWHVLFIDAMTTAQLLRARGEWPSQLTKQRQRTRS